MFAPLRLKYAVADPGFVARGTPIGTPEYVRAWGAERLEAEDTLLRQLPQLPDLQCAWLLLNFPDCSPRPPRAIDCST